MLSPIAPFLKATADPCFSVKTRIQLDPVTYNSGMFGAFRKVIANEGADALLTGVGPTFTGYFLQGAFEFGGYEFFKRQFINQFSYETASNNRTAVYLASSAAAEFFADIALCPLEATRIRLVSQPTFASGLVSGFTKIAGTGGIGAFYSGFGPILFKQVPYTMAKFVVYEKTAELLWHVLVGWQQLGLNFQLQPEAVAFFLGLNAGQLLAMLHAKTK